MHTTRWEVLAKNHIPGRTWVSLKKIWGSASLGFDLGKVSDLSEAIEPILAPKFESRDNVTVFEFYGGYVAGFHDAAVALLKCAYVLRSVGNCVLGGQPTWASVDAYHFSYLAGRALLALLGIHFVQIGDTYCVLDLFPEGRSSQEIAGFRKLNPAVRDPARLIFQKRSTPIPQSALWVLVTRVARIGQFSEGVQKGLQIVSDLGEGFGRSRNELLYRNSSWLYTEDYWRPTRSITINDDIYSYDNVEEFFGEQRDANFAFAAVLAGVLRSLAADIQSENGVALLPTSYGACLSKFEGFGIARLDAVFSTLYRKEGYGVEI
jgi:hypothetical protein